jgi:hypothetical protein
MFITGKSADFSDAKIFRGVYESPCGKWWSSQPITREQKAYNKVWNHCERHNKTMLELYNQLKSGSKENLPKWVRVWFIDWFEKE